MLSKQTVTLSVLQAVDNSFGNENLLCFVSAFGLDLGEQLFLALDDFVILTVSDEFKVNSSLEASDVDLVFGDSGYFLRLLVSHWQIFTL